jgi:hypothetical protein
MQLDVDLPVTMICVLSRILSLRSSKTGWSSGKYKREC